MAQIIHPDGNIYNQDQKRNELGYTIQEVFTHQQKMLKEAHKFLKLTYVKEPDKKR